MSTEVVVYLSLFPHFPMTHIKPSLAHELTAHKIDASITKKSKSDRRNWQFRVHLCGRLETQVKNLMLHRTALQPGTRLLGDFDH